MTAVQVADRLGLSAELSTISMEEPLQQQAQTAEANPEAAATGV